MMRDKKQQCAYVYKFSLIAFVIVLLLPILLWCMASNPYIPVRPLVIPTVSMLPTLVPGYRVVDKRIMDYFF